MKQRSIKAENAVSNVLFTGLADTLYYFPLVAYLKLKMLLRQSN